MKKNQTLFVCFSLSMFIFSFSPPIYGLELSIPAVNAVAGKMVEIPIRIDRVEGLAGVKLILSYNPEALAFKDAAKTNATASLMHIVNDKKPGTLIIVMAGAKGVGGENISILNLQFMVGSDAAGKNADIRILDHQLMSEQLKELKATIRISPLTVLSSSSSTP